MQHKRFYNKHKFRIVLLLICGLGLALLGSPTAAIYATGQYTVNTTTDTVDASIGDGGCATSSGECSLRATIQENNASFAAETITSPAGTYKLASGDWAAVGDKGRSSAERSDQGGGASDLTKASSDLELPPAVFYGWITPTLSFTPTVGMTVTATISDTVCGETIIQELDSRLAYSMQVRGESIYGPPNGCGESGKNIVFEVGDWVMEHDHVWENGQAWFHPLSVVHSSLQRFTISLAPGWNYVALPLEPVALYTAQSLCDQINSQGVTEIDRFMNGGWDGHICNLPFNDFTIESGLGYFIRSQATISLSLTIEGIPVTTASPKQIHEGWNSISLIHTDAYTAESLCDELISQGIMAVEIDRWHNSGWNGHLCGLPFNNFNIERGIGYFVKSSSSGTVIISP